MGEMTAERTNEVANILYQHIYSTLCDDMPELNLGGVMRLDEGDYSKAESMV